MPTSLRDLRLAQPREEPQVKQPPLSRGEHAEAGREDRPLLAELESAVEHACDLAVAVVALPPGPERQRDGRLNPFESQCLLDLGLADARVLCDLGDRRRALELRRKLCRAGAQARAQLLEAPRDLDRPSSIPEVALDLSCDRRDREGAEVDAALDVEPVDRLDQPDRSYLDEVLVQLASVAVPPGQALDERHVLLDDAIPCVAVPRLVVFAKERPDGLAARWFPSRRPCARTLLSCPPTPSEQGVPAAAASARPAGAAARATQTAARSRSRRSVVTCGADARVIHRGHQSPPIPHGCGVLN